MVNELIKREKVRIATYSVVSAAVVGGIALALSEEDDFIKAQRSCDVYVQDSSLVPQEVGSDEVDQLKKRFANPGNLGQNQRIPGLCNMNGELNVLERYGKPLVNIK